MKIFDGLRKAMKPIANATDLNENKTSDKQLQTATDTKPLPLPTRTKQLWYFHGSTASKFKAWDGKEHDVNILILANDEKDVRERYDECIQRNNLLPLDDPQFCEFVGADQMVNDYFTLEMIEELEEKHSISY